ncbi:DUF6507 family protein [Streptomyces sp. NPDC049555]|uniref:DUF6507 family protein n=1 Tax=unclassified Streptomyces TaxID=2593676 RepID=UPI0034161F6A
MSSWDIKPAAVQGVIQRTVAVVEKLEPASKSLNSLADSAGVHAGTLLGPCDAREGIVGMALKAYRNSAMQELKAIADRAQTSMQGAVDATIEYVRGDLEMAANLQHAAVTTTDPEKFTAYAKEKMKDAAP